MRLIYSFKSLNDLSDLSKGKKLLEILSSHGLIIEKADQGEPIRKEFDADMLSEYWKGVGPENGHLTCYFLFKGKKEIGFSGMVTWNTNLGPNTHTFNGLLIRLNLPKNFNNEKVINIGDELFTWSNPVYGYITEEKKYKSITVPGGLYYGLPEIFWVNYFGPPYLNESDFHIPADHVSVGQGKRIRLCEKPSDDILSNSEFLQNLKNQFGAEWFWKGNPNKPRRIPRFDHSALIKT